jgi:hypothetical protein
MRLDRHLSLRVTEKEDRVIRRLAKLDYRNRGEMVRLLIRREAKRLGVWDEAEAESTQKAA